MNQIKKKLFEWWHKLIHQHASPHDIALGLSLGIFVGFLPLMGIQMGVVLLLSLPFRKANKFAAISGVWISNPFTVIPIYMFIYWIGSFFYPQDQILSYGRFSKIMREILAMDDFIDSTKAFFALGGDIFLPMTIGGTILGIFAASAIYFPTRYLVRTYRCKVLHKCDPPQSSSRSIHLKKNNGSSNIS